MTTQPSRYGSRAAVKYRTYASLILSPPRGKRKCPNFAKLFVPSRRLCCLAESRTNNSTTMSSLKRKVAPGDNPKAKSAKTAKDAKPSTRGEPSKALRGPTGTTAKKSSGDLSGPPTKSIVSQLNDDEPMFPRGGGSVLTPLEKKQISIAAKADAAREEEFEVEKRSAAKKNKKTAKTKSKGGKIVKEDESSGFGVKIESLNFKVRSCLPSPSRSAPLTIGLETSKGCSSTLSNHRYQPSIRH
jgi:hypothetical protein